MSAYFQPGSTSVDLVVQTMLDERRRQAEEYRMVRAARPRSVGRLSLVGLMPGRLLGAAGAALRMPATGPGRPLAEG